MSEPSHFDVSQDLTIKDVVRASRWELRLVLEKADVERLDRVRRKVVSQLSGSDVRLYGFNTGFGDNRSRATIPTGLRGVIQDNLILSHSAGFGEPVEDEVVLAAMAIRVRTLVIGHSGIRPQLVEALASLYNSGLIPVVPRFGSVGASGDLAPLSHMALPLFGRGRVRKDGAEMPVEWSLLASHGVEKLSYRPSEEFPGSDGPESTLAPKEGLALNNGTALMAAYLSLAVYELENVLWHADLALALNTEAMCGVLDAHTPAVQGLRRHAGVNRSSERVLGFLKGSSLTITQGQAQETALRARDVSGVLDSTQDDYCLRSGPVIHGTALDALDSATRVVETELNSVTDNPLVFDDSVLSGSHFHGMPLSFAADQVRTAMAIVAGVSERRIAKVLNEKRNYGLPRHLVLDDPHGVKSGWMIAQYTAASMVNELKTRSMPYCVGNVTTGNESEDFVSMGANACRAAYEMVSVLRGIVSIELASAARALLIRVGSSSDARLSPAARRTLESFVEQDIEVWHTDDRPLEPILEAVSGLVKNQGLRAVPSC